MGLRLHIPLPGPFSYSTSLRAPRPRRGSPKKVDNGDQGALALAILVVIVIIAAIAFWKIALIVALSAAWGLFLIFFISVMCDEQRRREKAARPIPEPRPINKPDMSPDMTGLMENPAVKKFIREAAQSLSASDDIEALRAKPSDNSGEAVIIMCGATLTIVGALALGVVVSWWCLLAAGLGALIFRGGWSVHARSARDVAAYERGRALRAQRVATNKAMGQAEPRSSTDTFGSCPHCGHIDCHMIKGTTEAGTTRNCAVCLKDWTIKHSATGTDSS